MNAATVSHLGKAAVDPICATATSYATARSAMLVEGVGVWTNAVLVALREIKGRAKVPFTVTIQGLPGLQLLRGNCATRRCQAARGWANGCASHASLRAGHGPQCAPRYRHDGRRANRRGVGPDGARVSRQREQPEDRAGGQHLRAL